MDEFYVGYLPQAPPTTARRVLTTTALLLLAAAGLAALLVFAEGPFAATSFEYDREQQFAGVVQAISPPLIALSDGSSAVLVAPGKHGYLFPRDLQTGTAVAFRGKVIQRKESKVIEVASPIQAISAGVTPSDPHFSVVHVTGEVVDSKCFAGVMNPGSGKVHRGCAARCLHGGIPAALVSQKGDLYYLLDQDGKPLSREWISAHAGERISVIGKARSIQGARVIRVEKSTADEV
jgi:hypothetical protein